MLTEEEKKFVAYWEANRLLKKKTWRYLSVGLPMASLLVIAICINFFSGWYKRADMEIRTADPSIIIVLLAAVILIVVFITIFSARHKWDLNEQHYRELISRQENP